jgi:hypothetical protein
MAGLLSLFFQAQGWDYSRLARGAKVALALHVLHFSSLAKFGGLGKRIGFLLTGFSKAA